MRAKQVTVLFNSLLLWILLIVSQAISSSFYVSGTAVGSKGKKNVPCFYRNCILVKIIKNSLKDG